MAFALGALVRVGRSLLGRVLLLAVVISGEWATVALGEDRYLFTTKTNGVGNAPLFSGLSAISADAAGNLYVTDSVNRTVRKIDGAGDFNADGQSDLLWTNAANGDRFIWLMEGTSRAASVYLGSVGTSWQIRN